MSLLTYGTVSFRPSIAWDNAARSDFKHKITLKRLKRSVEIMFSVIFLFANTILIAIFGELAKPGVRERIFIRGRLSLM